MIINSLKYVIQIILFGSKLNLDIEEFWKLK